MDIVVENATPTPVQILDEADYISHCTNTLWKGMDSTILTTAKDE